MVDYLDYMYEQQVWMMSGKPRSMVSYDTIIHPFDYQTWLSTFILIFVEFILLLVMQNIWSYASGKPRPPDYIFQGFNVATKSRFMNSYEFCFRPLCLSHVHTFIHTKTLDSKRRIQNQENLNPQMVVLWQCHYNGL